MNCDDIKNLLYEYATKCLDEAELEAVEAHLKECEICKIELSMLQETIPLLDYWTPPDLSKDFTDRVLANIQAEKKSLWQKIIEALVPVRTKFPLEALAAGALVLMVIVVYKIGFTPEIDKTPRQITIESHVVTAKNPIVIESENTDFTLTKLTELIKAHNGRLLGSRTVEGGTEAILSIEQEKERLLLKALSELGKAQMAKDGYKDSDKNE
jgi:hypothetical protein